MSYLIVGLGNPGSQYESTRHNIGWMALDRLSFSSTLVWKDKFKGYYSYKDFNGERFYFLKPQTYMNLSGESIQALCKFFKVPLESVLVVHDELDLPYGTLAFKRGGGLAGHNGLKSLASCMGSNNFLRLRLGIGRPKFGSVSSWVLSGFSDDEKIDLDSYIDGAAEALEKYIELGFGKAAQAFSKKSYCGINS
jgi:PTH1 family peptidyl-tRNA hydrolase